VSNKTVTIDGVTYRAMIVLNGGAAPGVATAEKTEDTASASGDVGQAIMFIQKATPADLATDNDYAFGQMKDGRIYVDAGGPPVGALTETAPASDTASSGLNGRLQRIAQRVTSLIALFKTSQPATGASTAVASGTGAVTILAANANRIGATVFNDDANILYLLLGAGTVTTSLYTAQIPTNGYYEVPFGFTGILTGLWAADGSGSARVTEITA
jgi:hypothetical protein